MTTSEAGPSELREYLSVLWRRKYLIALTILVTLGAAIFYTQRQTPLYRSSAQVLVYADLTAFAGPTVVRLRQHVE